MDLFIDHCDFFRIHVANEIGQQVNEESLKTFVQKQAHLSGSIMILGIDEPFKITKKN